MNDVSWRGRLLGTDSSERSAGKFVPKLRVQQLVHLLGLREVAKPDRAEIAQRRPLGQAFADEVGHGLRNQYLAPVRRAHDPRRAVDRAAEEIVVAALHDAGVQPAADEEPEPSGRVRIGEHLLQFDGGADRVRRVVEGRVHAVARHLDDRSPVTRDGFARQRIVPRKSDRHLPGLLLPEARASLDVTEEKGDDAGRMRGHGTRWNRGGAASTFRPASPARRPCRRSLPA